MNSWRNRDIAADNIARYNRGEIGRAQYLAQSKALLLEEKAFYQQEHDKAETRLASLAQQIAEIEAEQNA